MNLFPDEVHIQDDEFSNEMAHPNVSRHDPVCDGRKTGKSRGGLMSYTV